MPLPTIGRTAEVGLVELKLRWGGQVIPLIYDYWPEPTVLNVGRPDHGSMRQLIPVGGWR
jgi:hypothetical protein